MNADNKKGYENSIVFVILLGFFLLSTGCLTGIVRKNDTVNLTAKLSHQGVPRLLITAGDGYNRGIQHGHAFRSQIHILRENSKKLFPDLNAYSTTQMAAHSMEQALSRLTHGDEIIKEIEGIAEGADVPKEWILALHWLLEAYSSAGCSALLMPTAAEGPLSVHTFDPIIRSRGAFRRILHVSYPLKGEPYMVLTFPGLVIASRGMNNAGLATGSTAAGRIRVRNPNGLPGAIAMRYLLQFCTNTEEAKDFLMMHRGLSKKTNITLLDAQGHAAIVEYAADKVGFHERDDHGPVYAANCFRSELSGNSDSPGDVNNWNRTRRLSELSNRSPHNLRLAMSVVTDEESGENSGICQDNDLMWTDSACIWNCKSRSLLYYPNHPTKCRPLLFTFQDSERERVRQRKALSKVPLGKVYTTPFVLDRNLLQSTEQKSGADTAKPRRLD